MRQELERRLSLAEREHAHGEDPAFADLPRTDRLWLVVLFVAALLGVAVQQAL